MNPWFVGHRILIPCCSVALASACASRNLTINQTGEIINNKGGAVGLLASLGEDAQVPALASQYRLGIDPDLEIQASWLLPGWPTLGLKRRIVDLGAVQGSLLPSLQYSQADLGTNARGEPIREHRIDLGLAAPASYRFNPLIAAYGSAGLQLRRASRGHRRSQWTSLTGLGFEAGSSTALRIECVGSWGAARAYYIMVGLAF